MKKKYFKQLKGWMSGGYLLKRQWFTLHHLYNFNFLSTVILFIVLIALCGCKNENESEIFLSQAHSSSNDLKNTFSCADAFVNTHWQVERIISHEGIFDFELSTEGTNLYFSDGEVTFFVPYLSIAFNADSEPTITFEHYGPYPVSFLSSNTLTIAGELFIVTSASDSTYSLISEEIEIIIK